MRQIILNLAVSLDGYIAGTKGEYDWCLTDNDYGMTEFFTRIDAIIMGGESYRLVKNTEGNPYPEMTSYVISRVEPDPGKSNVKIIRENCVEAVTALKQEAGKNIWLFGGSQIIELMLQHDLIDELMLAVHPVTLGDGIPLFRKSDQRKPWNLKKSIPYPSGLVQLIYTSE